jgi:hypothetical protein
MKTKFQCLILSLALGVFIPKANAQSLIQFWDFNQTRDFSGLGGDSLGTAYSYMNTVAAATADSTATLYADYTVSSLTKGAIYYSRPQTRYSSLARDSDLDNGTPGSFIFDYSSSNYSYFTSSDSGDVGGNMFIRARNPSDSCEFIMSIPTTGYKNISLDYALSASSTKGALYNIFSYSTNGGLNWNKLTSAMDTFTLGGGIRTPDTLLAINDTTANSGWYPVHIDFSSDPNVNNNSTFIFKFLLSGGNSVGSSGNDRYDNFAVWGTSTSGINELPAQAAGYNIYPNPASDFVNVMSTHYTGAKIITVYDVVGQVISVIQNSSEQTTINTSSLNSGVYFIEVKELTTGNKYTVKIVKE